MRALSRAAHSANDLGFVARGCGDYRWRGSAQKIHDRGSAVMLAATIAGFVLDNKLGRHDGPSPTYPRLAQHTGQYCDGPNQGHPSVALLPAVHCDAPNLRHPSVALALAV